MRSLAHPRRDGGLPIHAPDLIAEPQRDLALGGFHGIRPVNDVASNLHGEITANLLLTLAYVSKALVTCNRLKTFWYKAMSSTNGNYKYKTQ